jgi:hypothetical protein
MVRIDFFVCRAKRRVLAIATGLAIWAWWTGLVHALIQAAVWRVIAGEIDVEEVVLEEFHQSASNVAGQVIDHHHEASHRWSVGWVREKILYHSYDEEREKLAVCLRSLFAQVSDAALVAVFIFAVPVLRGKLNHCMPSISSVSLPCFDDVFDDCSHVVHGFAHHVNANVLADVLEVLRVTTIVVVCRARSSVQTSDICQILIPSERGHSCSGRVARQSALCNFIAVLIVQI